MHPYSKNSLNRGTNVTTQGLIFPAEEGSGVGEGVADPDSRGPLTKGVRLYYVGQIFSSLSKQCWGY